MGTYEARCYCVESRSYAVWNIREGVWVEGLLSGTESEAEADAAVMNEADAAFIMEVGR